jgi:hypothetical protein
MNDKSPSSQGSLSAPAQFMDIHDSGAGLLVPAIPPLASTKDELMELPVLSSNTSSNLVSHSNPQQQVFYKKKNK